MLQPAPFYRPGHTGPGGRSDLPQIQPVDMDLEPHQVFTVTKLRRSLLFTACVTYSWALTLKSAKHHILEIAIAFLSDVDP